MKDAMKIYNKCNKMVKDLGIETGMVWNVIPSKKRSVWGLCVHEGFNVYTILISDVLLDDSVPDKLTEETMLHEILHTVKGCQNHGTKWKQYANKINMTYGYNIKRTGSEEEKGKEVMELCRKQKHKHMVKCQKCGHEIFFQRECKTTKYAYMYKHIDCGGIFKRMY